MPENLDPRLHFVTATAIIAKKGDEPSNPSGQAAPIRFLIAKRAPTEKAFPNKWTVPGGKLVYSEYKDLPSASPSHPQWYNMMEWLVKKEVREEVNIEVSEVKYLTDLVFVRPDGYPVVTMSFYAQYVSGDVELSDELTDFKWVTAAEAKTYDMIDGIPEEIEDVETIMMKS